MIFLQWLACSLAGAIALALIVEAFGAPTPPMPKGFGIDER